MRRSTIFGDNIAVVDRRLETGSANLDIRGLFWKLRQAAWGPPPTTGLSMSNNVATAMGDHQSHPRLAQQAEEADCSTCSAITEDAAVQNETGALLRVVPGMRSGVASVHHRRAGSHGPVRV